MKNIFPTTALIILLLLSGCVAHLKDGPPNFCVNINKILDPKPRPLPKSKYGNPLSYIVNGKHYHVLKTARSYHQYGIASWYGTKFHGQLTSSREPYNMLAMTGASPTLPIPCFVHVTNLSNGRSIVVKINDRGPFTSHRILDLSYVAAKKLGYINHGTALVEIKAINFSYPPTPIKSIMLEKNISLPPRLFLQLGTFCERIHAEDLKKKLCAHIREPILILRSFYNQLLRYHVQIGPLAGINELNHLHNKLKKLGFKEIIKIKQ